MDNYNLKGTKDYPLVSILIPVYNREDVIIDTLESAINQSYKNIEVIVVDNKSTDNSFKIISDFSKKYENIRIFQNEENIGPVRNWLKCLEKAKGEYGKILFSDDLMESDFLEMALPYMKNNKIGFVFSSALIGPTKDQSQIWYKWKNESGVYPINSFVNDALIGKNIPASPGAAMFRMKDLTENLLTDIPSPSFHDFDLYGAGPDLLLYLMPCLDYSHVAFINKPLVFFRNHNNSITMKNFDIVQKRYNQARLYFAELIDNKQLMLNLLLYLWIGNILKNKFIKFSSMIRTYYFNKKSFTIRQWLKAYYSLLRFI
jgi:glycosyltransferase involved in cell wall biosynthesis